MQPVVEYSEALIEAYGVRPITIEDRSYFQSVFSNFSEPTSDYSFANNFIWTSSFNMYWKVISNHLCLFVLEEQCLHMFIPPCAEPNATPEDLRQAITESFAIMNDYNERHGKYFMGTIQYVSVEMMERIDQCGLDGVIVAPSPMGKDYIYDMEKMISLSGSGLDSRRHARNKFKRLYPDFQTRPFEASDAEACLELVNAWHAHKNEGEHDSGDYYLDPEKAACKMAIAHYAELELKGMVLIAEGKLIGFTFGEALNDKQALIIIEKTHPDYYGAPAMIFSEFCRQYWSAYPECNVGDHASNPNLRFTKQQYRPIRLMDKSVIMQACPVNLSR